jgi:hypothetical protein
MLFAFHVLLPGYHKLLESDEEHFIVKMGCDVHDSFIGSS